MREVVSRLKYIYLNFYEFELVYCNKKVLVVNKSLKQLSFDRTLFAWSNQKVLNPINIKKAKGIYLYDDQGKRYIDFSSQLMNVNIGHGRQEITEAVRNQMTSLSYVCPPFTTDSRGLLGEISLNHSRSY